MTYTICLCLTVLVSGVVGNTLRNEVNGSQYIGYLAGDGNIPVILSAPHGGYVEPDFIPTRQYGCYINGQCVWRHNCGPTSLRCRATTVMDMYTQELALLIREELHNLTGHWAAVVFNKLHRRKLDPNREIEQAAMGNYHAEQAYNAYMSYIEQARTNLQGQRGLFIDIHGHGHSIQRAELGYLITRQQLNTGSFTPQTTSIRSLFENRPYTMARLARGDVSFGAFLEEGGFPAVPSPSKPRPLNDPYFTGGHLTRTQGSRDGGLIDAIQIESARSHRNLPNRPNYAKALASTIVRFLQLHYGYAQ